MRLENYDIAICGMVDSRCRQHKPRIEREFADRVQRLEFQINGRGGVPGVSYTFTTQAPPPNWRFSLACYQHFIALGNAVATADSLGAESLLWIEDDCELAWNFDEMIDEVVAVKAPKWDLFYYGGNHSNSTAIAYSPHLMRVKGTLTTHLLGIRRSVFKQIIRHEPTDMIDALFANFLQHKCEAQAIVPGVAFQIPGRSTLWGVDVDYRGLMEQPPKVIENVYV